MKKEFNFLTIYGEIASIDTQIRELNNKKDILLKKLKYETELPIRTLTINEFNIYEQCISYIDSIEGWCLDFDGTIPARYIADCSNIRYKKLQNSNSLFRVIPDGSKESFNVRALLCLHKIPKEFVTIVDDDLIVFNKILFERIYDDFYLSKEFIFKSNGYNTEKELDDWYKKIVEQEN